MITRHYSGYRHSKRVIFSFTTITCVCDADLNLAAEMHNEKSDLLYQANDKFCEKAATNSVEKY